jgi:hypothetical protein
MAGYHRAVRSRAALGAAPPPPDILTPRPDCPRSRARLRLRHDRRSGIWESWNPDSFDKLAERQRERLIAQGALDPDPVRVFKLRCQACSILIGPGYASTDVWHDRQTNRWLCRGCAHWPTVEPGDVTQIATPDEVARLSIGELSRLLRQRTRQRKRRTPRQ